MIVISNNLLKLGIPLPSEVIIRINVAWIKHKDELITLVNSSKFPIYMDYPTGRKKPPKPTLKFNEIIDIINRFSSIKYIALSNIESASQINQVKKLITRKNIIFVPKIETEKGINNLHNIIKYAQISVLMLDREDLYTDINKNQEKFNRLTEKTRQICKKYNVKLLELAGVVFNG